MKVLHNYAYLQSHFWVLMTWYMYMTYYLHWPIETCSNIPLIRLLMTDIRPLGFPQSLSMANSQIATINYILYVCNFGVAGGKIADNTAAVTNKFRLVELHTTSGTVRTYIWLTSTFRTPCKSGPKISSITSK